MKSKKNISRLFTAVLVAVLLCTISLHSVTNSAITATEEGIVWLVTQQNLGQTSETALHELNGNEDDCSTCNDYADTGYPIMHPSEEMFDEWLEEYYESIAKASLMEHRSSVVLMGDPSWLHFDLLDHIWYCPENRSQGNCGNCWAWASTGCMEVELYKDWGIKDRLSVQWLNSVFFDGNLNGNQPWACCGRSATTFANFYTFNTTIAIPWNNTNADHIDEAATCEGHTLQDQSGISTYPYYQINSINAYGLPTYGLTQEQAINNIKTKLCENKALYYWVTLPTVADWEDPPDGFKYFWNTYDENTLWSPDFAQGHQWIEGEGGGHALLCVGWDETDPNNPYWIMINSWSTTPGRPNGIWHLDMNTNYSTWFWDSTHQNHKQAQGFEYFDIDFGLSAHAPTVIAGGLYTESEGSSITFTAIGSDDDGDALQYRWDFNSNGTYDTDWSSSNSTTHTWCDDHIGIVTVQVCDGQRTDTDTALVMVSNVAPDVNAGMNQTVDEGDIVSFSGSFTDPGCDTWTYEWEFGDGHSTTGTLTPTHAYGDNGMYAVNLTVTDDDAGTDTDTLYVTVYNVPPLITDLTMDQSNPQFILPVVHNLNYTGNFTDPGWLDTHTAEWEWGDSTSDSGDITEEHDPPDATGTATGQHVYMAPGVYNITLTVTDDDGGTDDETMNVTVVDEFGALEIFDEYIQNLSDTVFKGNPVQRKKAFHNMFNAIYDMLVDQEYNGAIQHLRKNIREKSDGLTDGDPKGDWIIDYEAQYHVCMKVDDLTAYLEYLLASLP